MKHVVTFGYAVAVILLVFSAVQPKFAQSGSTNAEREVAQADGTSVLLSVHGDENDRWFSDAQGYTVVEVPNRYVYALRDADGRLVPTDILVGPQVDPQACGLQQGIRPSQKVIEEIKSEALPDGPEEQPGPPTGAIPATPHPVEAAQPDGTKIKLRFRGGPKFHWYEDLNGYTVLPIPASYVYALRDAQGKLIATSLLAGKVDPSQCGLQKGIRPTP